MANGRASTVVAGSVVLLVLGGAALLLRAREKPYPISLEQRQRAIAIRQRAPDKPADVAPPVAAKKAPAIAETTAAPAETASGAKPTPLDLSPYVGLKSANFDAATQFPWKAAPRGSQMFVNVPLKIDGAIFLWGENNAKAGMIYPEKVTGIAVNRKFETLYVFHTAFFVGEAGAPIFEIQFKYDDGTFVSDKILSLDDSRDWLCDADEATKGPTAMRSTLAWYGEPMINDKKQPMRFCMTAVPNPQPDVEVNFIDLVSCGTKSAGCVLAMTTGSAGVMKRELSPVGTSAAGTR